MRYIIAYGSTNPSETASAVDRVGAVSDDPNGPSTKFPPFVRLWSAVVRRAAVDNKLYSDDADDKFARIGQDARAWLEGRYDTRAFNSFNSVCEMIGIPAEVVYAAAERLTEEDARKQRGMEFDD